MNGPPRAIATPCVQVCEIDQKNRLCLGCYRSLEEIARWSRFSDDQRARVMADLPARKAAYG